MKKLRELLRLHFKSGLSNRQIARALKLAASTVGYYIKAAKRADLSWERCCQLDDHVLQATLEPNCQQLKPNTSAKAPIDLLSIHQELKKKGVTRELLWLEYCQNSALTPYSYTEYCRRYREFCKQQKPSMRQTHRAGEKAFVDYAGPTVSIINAKTGVSEQAVIFVGVLGASNYTFAEATMTRSLPDWLGSHARMYEFFGGVPELTIPDNEKSAVKNACYYDPELNPHYAALAAHYDTVILPTRPTKPKDKAKVEVAVQVVERWILARLRHHQFFSLAELNKAIDNLLVELNDRPFKKLPGARKSQFEMLDQPALKPLPRIPYEYVDIKKCQVRLDYHIEVNKHFYSVPHQLIGQQVEYQLGAQMLEVFHRGIRIASHCRSNEVGGATTHIEHLPHAHRQHHQWSPQQFADWAQSVGQAMEQVASDLIQKKRNPECCYRIHLGFMNLAKRYGKSRLEKACQYAHQQRLQNFSSIRSILQTQIDQAPVSAMNDRSYQSPTGTHDNVRGAGYYSNPQQ